MHNLCYINKIIIVLSLSVNKGVILSEAKPFSEHANKNAVCLLTASFQVCITSGSQLFCRTCQNPMTAILQFYSTTKFFFNWRTFYRKISILREGVGRSNWKDRSFVQLKLDLNLRPCPKVNTKFHMLRLFNKNWNWLSNNFLKYG